MVKTEEKNVLVLNDFLSFTWCNLKVCPKKKLLQCLKKFYSKEAALEAFETLLEALPNRDDLEEQKFHVNFDPFVVIWTLLEQSLEEELPVFVCRNLNNVPKIEISKEYSDVQTASNFHKEHKLMKIQINEVFHSLNELKNQFQNLIHRRSVASNQHILSTWRKPTSLNLPCEFSTQNSTSSSHNKKEDLSKPKDLTYLQRLIDEEGSKQSALEEESDGDVWEISEDSDFEDDEQTLHLMANRQQRASLKHASLGGNKVSTKKPKVVKLEKNKLPVCEEKPKVILIRSKGDSFITDPYSYIYDSIENDEPYNPSPDQSSDEACEMMMSIKDEEETFDEENDKNLTFVIVEQVFDENVGHFTLYKCSSCGFCSNDEPTLIFHKCKKKLLPKGMNKSMNDQKYSGKKRNVQTQHINGIFCCPHCDMEFSTYQELQDHKGFHKLRQKINDYRCPLCGNRFAEKEWVNHVKRCHGSQDLCASELRCTICDVYFADKKYLSHHKAYHDLSRPFECLECKFRFYTQKAVENHFKSHATDKVAVKCPFCLYRTHIKYRIHKHMLCHTGDKKFKCPLCGHASTTYKSLQIHVATHTAKRNIPCTVCGKKFQSRENMISHRRIHSEDRPHKCPVCGKGFKFGLQMTLHHRRHLDIRNHACPLCPYKSRTAAVLRGHMNTHSNAKPFKCSECDFGANHKSYLNWHVKYHHPRSE